MSRIARLSPQAARWGEFDCGDGRLTNKLAREALRSAGGLQALYGVVGDQDDVLAAMALRAGELAAPTSVRYQLGQGELDVPTVHMEVLAVRQNAQRLGYGRDLVRFAVRQSEQVGTLVGVRTLSVEATSESKAFYARLGFDSASAPWPDGSWPMWLVLGA